MIKSFQECRSLDGWQPVKVASQSDPDTVHTVFVNPWGRERENICDCRGYQFRGYCRHQPIASLKVCGWSGLGSSQEQTAEQRERKICPSCGGPTRWAMEIIDE